MSIINLYRTDTGELLAQDIAIGPSLHKGDWLDLRWPIEGSTFAKALKVDGRITNIVHGTSKDAKLFVYLDDLHFTWEPGDLVLQSDAVGPTPV